MKNFSSYFFIFLFALFLIIATWSLFRIGSGTKITVITSAGAILSLISYSHFDLKEDILSLRSRIK